MARDQKGNPIKGNQSNEKAKDPENKVEAREDKGLITKYLETQALHHDRLKTIEQKLGIEHKEDGMKGEDQTGSKKDEANTRGRKRH